MEAYNKEKKNPKEASPGLKKKLLSTVVKAWKDISWQEVLNLFLWASAVNLVIETLAQIKYSGVLGGLFSIFQSPYVFFYNVSIIMATISISLLFRRRYFVMSLLSVSWLALGLSNFILLSYRVTPFSAVELKLIDAALGVMKSYVSVPTLIVFAFVCVSVIGVIIIIWKKAKIRGSVNYISSLYVIATLTLLVQISTQFGMGIGVIKSQFPNLVEAYQSYGFVYCFSNSLINTGINKPKDYSIQKVEQIQTNVGEKLAPETTAIPVNAFANDSDKPNIIFLQLESFFDITALEGLKLSQDPIPNYRRLVNDYSSGFLSVPVVGAGTANTEFEIITGMNLDFFGPGEYPYKTVLKNQTCETICYDLKNHGYKTQAMHNNRATFYARNEIFSQFGFDIFTSVELMNVQEYTPNGWAKDKALIEELIKALTSTPEKDFIYTISVQGHGNYPTEPSPTGDSIQVMDGIENEGRKNQIQYYANQLYEMDQFLGDLMEQLNSLNERTVLVAYGDHLPSLNIQEEDLTRGNLYQTQYVVWNNCNLNVEKEDLEAYQLFSRVLGQIGVSDGVVNAFHQTNKEKKDTPEYLNDLQVLGYDLFYGDHISTGRQNIYQPTTIQYGVKNVEIDNVFRDQSDMDYLIIKGEYFTKYSRVYINEEEVECELLDTNTLRIHMDPVKESINIIVKQSYKGKLTLQTSNTATYNSAGEAEYLEEDRSGLKVTKQPSYSPSPEDIDWASLIDEEAAIGDD